MINKIKRFIRVPYLPYSLFLSALFIVSIIIFYQLDKNILSNISNNSALYLLSAMAQALAAIIAIVLGFSFVAVQVSAQIWSPRVFDLILKGRALWSLLVMYGFSILYDLLLLRIIPEKNIDEFLVYLINGSIVLTFVSFMLLFPYAYHTIERLKPEKIIQGIIKIKDDNLEQLRRDTILPVVDIMNKAIIANDPHTLKVGLDELEKLIVDVVKSSKIDSLCKLKIAQYYSGKISRLIDTSFNQNDEDSVIEIVDSLKNIGEKSIRMRWSEVPPDEIARKSNGIYRNGVGISGKTDNYDKIASEIKIVLSDACVKAIGRKWSRATKSILNARGSLQVISHEEFVLDIMYNNISQISNDFHRLSNEEKIFSMDHFIEAVHDIIIELINRGIYFDDRNYITVIKGILNVSLQVITKEEEYYKIYQIIGYITNIGIEAAKKDHKLKDDIKECFGIIADSETFLDALIVELGNGGYGLARESKKSETIWICSCLKDIGILYLSKKMYEPTNDIFSFLEGIENNYRHTKSSDVLEVTEKIIEIIEELGYKSIDYKLEKSSREVINSLIQIGMMNENIIIKARVCKTLKDMQGKLENKEIFKSIMEINEKAQGYQLVKFQEFKKFCDLDTVKHPR
ncbi:MAG: DUF2254 family protein [Candidatus Methanoperedens sp.]|nr:DUF2254 family protein [Candidatus Methanoperedens sp.]